VTPKPGQRLSRHKKVAAGTGSVFNAFPCGPIGIRVPQGPPQRLALERSDVRVGLTCAATSRRGWRLLRRELAACRIQDTGLLEEALAQRPGVARRV
jgi:hypothetical protein